MRPVWHTAENNGTFVEEIMEFRSEAMTVVNEIPRVALSHACDMLNDDMLLWGISLSGDGIKTGIFFA